MKDQSFHVMYRFAHDPDWLVYEPRLLKAKAFALCKEMQALYPKMLFMVVPAKQT